MAAAFLTSLKVLPGDQQNVKRGCQKEEIKQIKSWTNLTTMFHGNKDFPDHRY